MSSSAVYKHLHSATCPACSYVTADEAKHHNLHIKKLSGTKFRQMLRSGEDIPEWFAFKSVVGVLRQHSQQKA